MQQLTQIHLQNGQTLTKLSRVKPGEYFKFETGYVRYMKIEGDMFVSERGQLFWHPDPQSVWTRQPHTRSRNNNEAKITSIMPTLRGKLRRVQ